MLNKTSVSSPYTTVLTFSQISYATKSKHMQNFECVSLINHFRNMHSIVSEPESTSTPYVIAILPNRIESNLRISFESVKTIEKTATANTKQIFTDMIWYTISICHTNSSHYIFRLMRFSATDDDASDSSISEIKLRIYQDLSVYL